MTLKVELEAIRCSTTTELDRESKKLNKNISIAEEVSINNYGVGFTFESNLSYVGRDCLGFRYGESNFHGNLLGVVDWNHSWWLFR